MTATENKAFYYQIKGKNPANYGVWGSVWSFPPLACGIVYARDRKHAKELIEDEYEHTFPTRVLSKDLASNEFLLHIQDAKEHHFRLYEEKECRYCGAKFRKIDLYNDSNSHTKGGSGYCSDECQKLALDATTTEYTLQYGTNRAIYCITHKPTGKRYIGQTTQSFTLRWWQHIKAPADNKFHKFFKETDISEWTFEVLEMLTSEQSLDEREQFYIDKFDSIKNGFNSRPQITQKQGDSDVNVK